MRKLQLLFALVGVMGLWACSDQALQEDTVPANHLEDKRGQKTNRRGWRGQNDPFNGDFKLFGEMTIALEYPEGFDRVTFRDDYGAWFGLTEVVGCIDSPTGLELWTVQSMSEEDFEFLLNLLFEDVLPPKTTSNGTGGNEPYAAYVPTPPQDEGKTSGLIPIMFYYNGTCN